MEIGLKLKEAREQKGITLAEIEKETKIRKKYLQAIEDNKFDVLPGEVYVKVFIKGYANQVGLDGDEMSREYQAMVDQLKREEEEAEFQQDEEDSKEKSGGLLQNNLLNIIIAVIITIVVVVIVYNVFLINNSGDALETLSPEAVQEQQVDEELPDGIRVEEPQAAIAEENQDSEEVYQEEQPDEPLAADQVTAKPEQESLRIIAVGKSWIQVIVDGKQTYQGFIDKGEVKEYTGKDKLSLKIGNGNAIKVERGNQILGPWGESGQVIKQEISF